MVLRAEERRVAVNEKRHVAAHVYLTRKECTRAEIDSTARIFRRVNCFLNSGGIERLSVADSAVVAHIEDFACRRNTAEIRRVIYSYAVDTELVLAGISEAAGGINP